MDDDELGFDICKACHGDGVCAACRGSGKRINGEPCPVCEGNGLCTKCGGTGTVDMDDEIQ